MGRSSWYAKPLPTFADALALSVASCEHRCFFRRPHWRPTPVKYQLPSSTTYAACSAMQHENGAA